MKAAILEKINEPLVIANVELTDLLVGQVLVKVLVSGICGAQLQEIAGHKNNVKYVPHLLGHEGCGIVEKIGSGVTTVKVGDKVVMHWRKGDGIESDFPKYIYNGKTIGGGKITTLSEYSISSENRITSVPQDTPNELCALLGCGLSTALGTIENETNLKMGESVMIIGIGGLGINLINAAQLFNASPIIGVDIHENKREVCKTLGVDFYINCKEENIQETLQNKFGIKGVDVIIDTSGNKKSLEETIPLLSGKGRYILVGQLKPGESIELKNANHLFDGSGKSIKATQGGQFSPSEDIKRYISLHKAGILKIDNIISHKMKLEQINDAIDLVKKGQAGRIIINM
ncbi:MAG: Zinc-containing alcohol dehydrogenase superfamily protein [Parcubacteria group bacterium Athens0714_16]|nr:MAG: Zinc-containing alcohol dehydrogenase superfamily protein [Parcubacteria group bacterium Athens0714_16]